MSSGPEMPIFERNEMICYVVYRVKGYGYLERLAATCLCLVNEFCHLLVTDNSASWVEERGLKPNWRLDRSSFTFLAVVNLLVVFSRKVVLNTW